MVDPAQVRVSDDGQWVYDGYQWWPIAQVPVGTTTANGYTWNGHDWLPATPAKRESKGWGTFAAIAVTVVLVVGFVIALIAILPSSWNPSDESGNTSASASSSSGIDRGLGSQDASADATVGPLRTNSYGGAEATVRVKNSSEKRSNYSIDLSAVSSDGKTQYATTMVFIQNVDPGQSAQDTATFFQEVPRGSKVTIKTVERMSAVG